MWDFTAKKNMDKESGFEPLAGEDASEGDGEDAENLLLSPLEARPRIRRGPSWRLFALCLVLTSCFSAVLGAWIGNATRRGADAFSIRHTSQYCKLLLFYFLGCKQRLRDREVHVQRFIYPSLGTPLLSLWVMWCVKSWMENRTSNDMP